MGCGRSQSIEVHNPRVPTQTKANEAKSPSAAAAAAAQTKGASCVQRMLLTSSGLTLPSFQSEFMGLLRARKPEGTPKILYVPDAAVGNGCDANTAYNACASFLKRLGMSHVECAELRTLSPEALKQKLQDVDCIYVEMGNTYFLRYYMRTSGFDKLLPPLVRKNGVVYVGASAGSMSAGKTIDIASWKGWDDPGYGKQWDLKPFGYSGLDLIPGGKSVFPHFGPQWGPLVQEKKATLDHEVIVIDEEHAFVIDGDRQERVPKYIW